MYNSATFVFSGKTFFLVELLKWTRTYLQPSPQRIIWLYKRWQPLYDVIKNTVLPRVEFIKGIPLNLEKDDFLNTRVRNLIVLDDLATDASKDSRITDLFTEGSHHRNLSVFALNQNLYFSKDPTQRRNCHYLILFNNPVDKQPVMTLARQMYQHNPRELLSHFQDAIASFQIICMFSIPIPERGSAGKQNGFNIITGGNLENEIVSCSLFSC